MLDRSYAPILLVAFAVLMGSIIDAMVKAFAPDAGLHHLIAWRFLFGGLIALAVFRAQKRPMPQGEAIRFHTMRGLMQLFAAFLFFYALTQLPLAEITIIGFTAALMVPGIARIMLSEHLRPMAIIAAIVGFAGAALAVSGTPSIQNEDANRTLGLLAGFTSAFVYALVLILLRMRATKEDATTIAMFTNVVPAIAMLPVTIGLFGLVNIQMLPLFALFGLLGFATWYLMTLGYARAPAQRLAPIEYTALVWSGLLGAIFFHEVPGWQLWIGGIVIIAACLIVAFEAHFATRKATGLPSSDIPE